MHILIADDEAVSRRLLQSYVQKWGYEVATAQNGAEAWALFEKGTYPVVITDWMMPEVDGLELVRRIRADPRPAYVYAILLTARSQKEDLVQGMEAGADDFLTKPFDRDELRVRLRAAERIIRLEHSLAEQNQALREAQSALVQAARAVREIDTPITEAANHLAGLRRDVQAEGETDLGSFREQVGRTCDQTIEELQRVRDMVRTLRNARFDGSEVK
jgi:DNA-binding response OmpR family regulator